MIPEVRWRHGDDLCDCTFQRIGFWTNPYLARTLEIRLCCMWKKLDEQYPGLMREIPAFTDYNNGDRYVEEPTLWNGESDMPVALWHRQIAVLTGMSLSDIREKFAGQEPPKGWANDPDDKRNTKRRSALRRKKLVLSRRA